MTYDTKIILIAGRKDCDNNPWHGKEGRLVRWNREEDRRGLASVEIPNPGGKERKEPDIWRLRLPAAAVCHTLESGSLLILGNALDFVNWLHNNFAPDSLPMPTSKKKRKYTRKNVSISEKGIDKRT